MKIKFLQIQNLRCFKSLPKLQLSPSINLFIGANNSGKSTILNAVFSLQKQCFTHSDVSIGRNSATITFYIDGAIKDINGTDITGDVYERLEMSVKTGILYGYTRRSSGLIQSQLGLLPNVEPFNLIYPYLSKRKAVNYSDQINEENANSVNGDFSNLYSKIDRISNPHFQPANSLYTTACKDVLGFEVSTIIKGSGKIAAYYVHEQKHIPLNAMGEGVANILGLITDLCIAENKIFIIEEPENDIHPKALKALLKIIIEQSKRNQFFISTHSNIVMKYLGSANDSKVFNVINDECLEEQPKLILSRIKEVSNDSIERRSVLEELGYDFFDFDLWEAWLFLEESSAEVIINKLIHWFVPSLIGRVRSFSANGTSKVMSKFEDFNNLFVFLHLQSIYRNKVWVKLDGGEAEQEIINKMKSLYTSSGWSEEQFSQFSRHNFEEYYPSQFADQISDILSINDKQKKRTAKKELLDSVKDWIKDNELLAKEEFSETAKEVIDYLKVIDESLKS